MQIVYGKGRSRLVFRHQQREAEDLRVEQLAPELSITAERLMRKYEENELAADQRYKGKVIVVTGVINSVGTDVLNTLYVTLDSGGGLFSVQCYFADSHARLLSTLREGLKVDIKGRCDGKPMNIQLYGCTIHL